MIRILGTVFAALLGLAFGSFLNVCLSRWPNGESIVTPRSHCRNCGRTLAWWENIPLATWLALRGRCRDCGSWIGWRYVIVEVAVGALWATVAWRTISTSFNMDLPSSELMPVVDAVCTMAFYWLLVALAVLDAEHLWLPDLLTLPGIAVGFVLTNFQTDLDESPTHIGMSPVFAFLYTALGIVAAAGLILLIRWTYWLIRRREGIGLGDAKLMALLAAWLGLPGALLAFALGVVLGAAVALIGLAVARSGKNREVAPESISSGAPVNDSPAFGKLPLGTFLCIGGVVSSLWGHEIIAAYMHAAGF